MTSPSTKGEPKTFRIAHSLVEMIEPPPYYEERDKSQFKVSTRKINDGPLTTG